MDHAQARAEMIEEQIVRRGVRDPQVLAAMNMVPREDFVPSELVNAAYVDAALPIAEGQTISQPYIVAAMLEAAQLGAGDKVLEVGAGSGYAAAVISRIAAKVVAVERIQALTAAAHLRLAALGYDNVELVTGDGSLGWPAAAPFDAIIVSAGGPDIPQALKSQLADRGRLVMPVGPPGDQRLLRLFRHGDAFTETDLFGVRFVALVGEKAWQQP
jgi:protein-L-isoaspartate(D-aspartate) O-methyltransferase